MRRRGDRYFDGYERVSTTDEQGRVRRELRYTAEWYGYEVPGQQKKLKLRSAVLTCVMLAAYFYGQLHPAVGGMVRYLAIPSLFALLPMMYLLIGLVNFLMAKEKWELRVLYGGYRRLYRSGVILLILLGIWVGMEVVFICLNPSLFLTELWYLLSACISTAAQALLVAMLYRNKPVVVEGPTIR